MGRPKQFDADVAVERAMVVFWTKGYGATTPQDLVDALQIGKGSLYNAFGSKRELFDRALARYRQFQDETLATLLDRPGAARERIRAGLRYLIDANFAGEQPRGCLAVNTAAELGGRDAAATTDVQRSFDRTGSALRAVIVHGQATGEIDRDVDPDQAADLLLATSIAIQVMARTATDKGRLVRIADAALDRL